MKLLFKLNYSAIALIITANLSLSQELGQICTHDDNTGTCAEKCPYRQVAFSGHCDKGKCCGYVRCKEQNTNFNCMTEADCLGYTNQGGVCPPGSLCCIRTRGSIPSPDLVADESFFSAEMVAENPLIVNLAPGVLNAFNTPSPAENTQNQNLGYLGGAQQVGGGDQQPEAVAPTGNEGLWDDLEFSG